MRGGVWHRKQRENRLQHAEFDAQDFLKEHKRTTNTDLFFLLGLYLGEGAKGEGKVLFANANPRVIQAFLLLLRKVFPLDEKRLKIQLLLRYDQDKQKTQLFWSTITKIPISQFQKVQSDLRTKNIPTFASYKGVCAICYSDAKIQRFLLALQRQHLDSILSQV